MYILVYLAFDIRVKTDVDFISDSNALACLSFLLVLVVMVAEFATRGALAACVACKARSLNMPVFRHPRLLNVGSASTGEIT